MHNTSLFDFPRSYFQHLLKSDPDYKHPLYAKFSNEARLVVEKGEEMVEIQEESRIQKLKPHHHVCLDNEFKEDCRVWENFLASGISSVS